MEFTITLTEIEYKAMQYIANTPADWADNLVHSRAESAINEIVQLFVTYALANSLAIPSTTDEIIAQAYSLGVIKTAEERNQESLNV